MSEQKNKEYTTDDILALPEGVRAELIDGKIYYMASPGRTHQQILAGITVQIYNYIKEHGGECQVYPAPFAVFIMNDKRTYFEPDFVVYNEYKAKVENYKELGLNSETAVMFNITSREQVIVNTWYGGEMKKGMFSMMNYYLPLKGIASMHCSANTDMNGENTAIFFGLSGTGKTTLSTDPKRLLIGDAEPGWDDNGLLNCEGGGYAKDIELDKESEQGR